MYISPFDQSFIILFGEIMDISRKFPLFRYCEKLEPEDYEQLMDNEVGVHSILYHQILYNQILHN